MTTLTAQGCRQRRERLIAQVEADLLVIVNPRHLFYLCNLLLMPQQFASWGRPFLLINGRTGHSTLVVDNFAGGAAEAAFADEVAVWTWYDGTQNPGVPVFAVAAEQLRERIAVSGARRVGIEAGWMPFVAGLHQPVDLTPALLAMQRRKDADELALIREALAATEAGHRALRSSIHAGQSEMELHALLYEAIVTAAGHPVVLMGDVLSGERAAGVSGEPSMRQVKAGELVILDTAPIVNGYRADFTMTLCVDQPLTPQQASIEAALHSAMDACASTLRPGVACADIHSAMWRAFDEAGWAAHILHHAGHGLGLGHPEPPFLVPHSQETLVSGDIIALEPGLYGPDWGARIEHIYRITEDGHERLTAHSTHFAPGAG